MKKKATTPEKKLLVAGLLIVVIALVVSTLSNNQSSNETPAAIIKGHRFRLEIADTELKREQGLSGRSSLGTDNGMLFVFDRPNAECFWMKDMLFNLDIIWLDNSNRVIHLEQNLSPATYPHEYCPDSNADYVIEINANNLGKLNLKIGDQITLVNR